MTDKWHGGKGSKRRPGDNQAYEDNWEKIFGKKTTEPTRVQDVTGREAESSERSTGEETE